MPKVEHLNTNLKAIVIHQVLKTAGDRKTNLKIAEAALKIGKKERLFIEQINKAYFNKSGPTYGIFADEKIDFRDYLKTYIDKDDFYTFSTNSIKHYKKVIEDVPAASGGFLIFAHYSNAIKKHDYVLVLSINNKDGFVVNEKELTISDIKNLDLNKVDVACIVNLTKWEVYNSGKSDDIKTYLSFIKGKKDISHYFMSFIDCDNKTTSTESTKRLIIAFDSYCEQQGYERDKTISKKNEIFQYCAECIENGKEILLSAVSAIIDPEYPEAFKEFASDEDFGVSEIISGDKSQLKKIKFVSHKTKKLILEFDLDLLDDEVFLNKTKRELVIKNLPEEFIAKIP